MPGLFRHPPFLQPKLEPPPTIYPGAGQTVVIGTGIHVGANVGTPAVLGPPQTVTVGAAGIHVGANVGIPTVVGGNTGVTLYIGNVGVTGYLLGAGLALPRHGSGGGGSGSQSQGAGPISITSVARGRKQASFDLFVGDGSGYTPEAFQAVVLMEEGVKRFTGCIKTVTTDPVNPGFSSVLFHVLCGDKGTICDNRVVIKNYESGEVDASTAAVVAGGTGWQVGDTFTVQGGDGAAAGQVLAVGGGGNATAVLITSRGGTYIAGTSQTSATGGSAGAGLTVSFTVTGPTFQSMVLDIVANFLGGEGITTTGVDLTSFGSINQNFTFNYTSVSQAFDQIATATGAQWWVDDNGVLYFVSPLDAPACPFSISETSDNFRSLTVSQTTAGYGNKFYAVSNRIVTPSNTTAPAITESSTYVGHPYGPFGIQPFQPRAYDLGFPPFYLFTNLPIALILSVKKNGVDAGAWNWFPNGVAEVAVPPPTLTAVPGDVMEITYIPIYQNSAVNTGAPASPGSGARCGSGIVEQVVQAPNVTLQSDLDAITAAAQSYYGTIPKILNFETDTPGAAVGQALSVDLAFCGLASTTVYITQVTAVINSLNPGASDLGEGTAFHWQIEATTVRNIGTALQWLTALVQRSQFPLPVPRFETASFVAGAGSNIAGGTPAQNPYQVKHTGQAVKVTAACGTPPTGQDLLIDILVNGVTILGINPLVIPDASAANTIFQTSTFDVPVLYLLAGDIVTFSLSYRTKSLTATAAANLSVDVYWSY